MEEALYDCLFNFLSQIEEITEEDKEALKKSFVHKSFRKGEYISEYGKVNDKLAFVCNGYCPGITEAG